MGRDAGHQNAQIASEPDRHRGDGPGLDHQELRPAEQEADQRRVRLAQVDVLAAGARHHGRELAVGKRRDHGERRRDEPHREQPSCRAHLAGDLGRDQEDPGSDHRPGDQRGRVEEPELANQLALRALDRGLRHRRFQDRGGVYSGAVDVPDCGAVPSVRKIESHFSPATAPAGIRGAVYAVAARETSMRDAQTSRRCSRPALLAELAARHDARSASLDRRCRRSGPTFRSTPTSPADQRHAAAGDGPGRRLRGGLAERLQDGSMPTGSSRAILERRRRPSASSSRSILRPRSPDSARRGDGRRRRLRRRLAEQPIRTVSIYGVFARRFSSGGAPLGERVPGQHLQQLHAGRAVASRLTPTATSSSCGTVSSRTTATTGACSVSGSRARAPRVGVEFHVNTYTSGHPDLRRASPWTPAATSWWPGEPESGRCARPRRLRAPVFERGASSGEFRGQHLHPGRQGYPAVGMDADGNFVIVWESMAARTATPSVCSPNDSRAPRRRSGASSRSTCRRSGLSKSYRRR